jgi:hypothetical protein
MAKFPGIVGQTTKISPTPPELLIPRLRSSLKAVDVDGFFVIVGEALEMQLQAQGGEVPDGAVPFYVHSFPKERFAKEGQPFDGITWKVLSSTMAPMDNAGGRIPRKPTWFQDGRDPRLSGYQLITQMWEELATIEFTVWSKSSDTRSKLLVWFHKMLMRYANVLQFFDGRGISMFQFVGRGEDQFETREQQEVHFGTLTYQFRVQYLDTFSTKQLDSLTAYAQIDNADKLTFELPPTDSNQ